MNNHKSTVYLTLISKLTEKLSNGTIVGWISDYLLNRYQFVQYNRHNSDTVKFLSGVPQGSVLAPLLFLLFIDDIVETLNVKIRLFADDCMLYSEIKDINDQIALNNSLHNVAQWCRDWQMVVNSEKNGSSEHKQEKKVNYYFHIPLMVSPFVQ